MTTSPRVLALSLAVGAWLGIGHAQPVVIPPTPPVLLSTQFHTPLSYEATLARLDEYYDVQIGRKLAVALPLIGPHRHFELWHDMWITFEAAPGGDNGTKVTIKRPADGTNARLVKSWMLNLAGRVDAPLPLVFKEEPPLRSAEGDLYASARDVARVLQSDGPMKALSTWEHVGLVVSASPMISVIMAPAGLHGIHHITVSAETAVAAKQFWSRLLQCLLKPGIYSAYSEEWEVEQEIQSTAQARADTIGITASQAIYVPRIDPKLIETKVRAEPGNYKHLLAAQGQYDIRFRIDKPYRKVVVSWAELAGYSRAEGKHQGERPLGQTTLASPRMSPQSGPHLIARTKLETLQPGAYRVRLQGESPAGELMKIDERTYWFDGKSFEEL